MTETNHFKNCWVCRVLEDDKGNPSSSRIQMMGGWAVATFIMIWYAIPRELDVEFLSMYLLFSGGVYGWALKQAKDIQVKEIEANKPPAPEPIQPPPAVVINAGATPPTNTKSVDMNVEGDVNVRS